MMMRAAQDVMGKKWRAFDRLLAKKEDLPRVEEGTDRRTQKPVAKRYRRPSIPSVPINLYRPTSAGWGRMGNKNGGENAR
jgi:hypothetical protein